MSDTEMRQVARMLRVWAVALVAAMVGLLAVVASLDPVVATPPSIDRPGGTDFVPHMR